MVANTVNEENLKILRMIEERRITAEQGAQLLASGNKPASELAVPAPKSGKTRWFRVLVTDTASEKVRQKSASWQENTATPLPCQSYSKSK